MRSRLAVAVLAGLLLLSGCSSSSSFSSGGRAQDDRLPALTLASLDGGSPLALRDLKGPAVVNLWASWCGPCKRELPHYADFAQKYADRVDVVGIDFQETKVDAARALARTSGVTYPLYEDPDGRLRPRGLPKLVLIDSRGRIAYQDYVEIKSTAQLEKLVRTHLGVGA